MAQLEPRVFADCEDFESRVLFDAAHLGFRFVANTFGFAFEIGVGGGAEGGNLLIEVGDLRLYARSEGFGFGSCFLSRFETFADLLRPRFQQRRAVLLD